MSKFTGIRIPKHEKEQIRKEKKEKKLGRKAARKEANGRG